MTTFSFPLLALVILVLPGIVFAQPPPSQHIVTAQNRTPRLVIMEADLQPFTQPSPVSTITHPPQLVPEVHGGGGRLAFASRSKALASRLVDRAALEGASIFTTKVLPSPTRDRFIGRYPALDAAVREQAQRFQIDPILIYALVWQESGGRTMALSHKGALGPMQLMPATAARFHVKDRRNIPEAVRGGVEYLVWLLDRYDGNVRLALAGYNAGEGAVDAYLTGRSIRTREGKVINPRGLRTLDGIPPYIETQNYVRQIAAHYQALRHAVVMAPSTDLSTVAAAAVARSPERGVRGTLYVGSSRGSLHY